MRALLRSGEWVEIETDCLFHNQYNTRDKRIFDKDIQKIEGDVRAGLGKCKYCGAIVKRGEEEKHFKEEELKMCDECWWYRYKRVSTQPGSEEVEIISDINGAQTKKVIKTETAIYEKQCSYNFNHTQSCAQSCAKYEHRALGIDWFTPDNTFFLKYPNGFDVIAKIDLLKDRGFIFSDALLNAKYFKKIGSYQLCANIECDNGQPVSIKSYTISNCRRRYTFRYLHGEWFIYNHFGWEKVKSLLGVPSDVIKQILNICIW